jgi:Cys-tRNA(Pro)/Cys-tRNA(Cys) deacylase
MRTPRIAIEEQALAESLLYINRGQRGLQVRLNPRDAASLLKAVVAPLVP